LRIAIASTNYQPEEIGIAVYTTMIAEDFAAAGHEVIVSTCLPHYPGWEVFESYRGKARRSERTRGVAISRVRPVMPRPRDLLTRIFFDLTASIGIVCNLIRKARDSDVWLIVSPPIPLALLGGLAARILRIPCAVWVQDLPVAAAKSVGTISQSSVARVGQWMERTAYRQARLLGVISEGFADTIRREIGSEQSIFLASNWPSVTSEDIREADELEEPQLGNRSVLLHAGNMGAKQALPVAVETISRSSTEGFVFVLIGEGVDSPRCRELAAESVAGNVLVLPLQPRNVLLGWLKRCNALLIHQDPNLEGSVVPSKLLMYMAAGKPIIVAASITSEAARIVTAAKCGVVVDPRSPQEIINTVTALRADPIRAAELGANAIRWFARGPTRATQVADWLAHLGELSALQDPDSNHE
jgi:colanic acid biosynthesis glycosyl transferase WcaI